MGLLSDLFLLSLDPFCICSNRQSRVLVVKCQLLPQYMDIRKRFSSTWIWKFRVEMNEKKILRIEGYLVMGMELTLPLEGWIRRNHYTENQTVLCLPGNLRFLTWIPCSSLAFWSLWDFTFLGRVCLWLAQWWSHGGNDLNTKLVLLLCEGPMTVGEINVVVGRMTLESPSRPLVLPVC